MFPWSRKQWRWPTPHAMITPKHSISRKQQSTFFSSCPAPDGYHVHTLPLPKAERHGDVRRLDKQKKCVKLSMLRLRWIVVRKHCRPTPRLCRSSYPLQTASNRSETLVPLPWVRHYSIVIIWYFESYKAFQISHAQIYKTRMIAPLVLWFSSRHKAEIERLIVCLKLSLAFVK